ncbi:MAG: hypothetical protein ACMXYC_03170 [Candidatus Woesearchaeota archaeon]
MRAQVTLFMTLGILLLLFAGLAFVVVSMNQEQHIGTEARLALERSIALYPPEAFITYCVEYHIPLFLQRMSVQGGTLYAQGYEHIKKDDDIIFWYTQESGNTLISHSAMSAELQESLLPTLERCIDMNVYVNQGFKVSSGQLQITRILMHDEYIDIDISYPILLEKDNTVTSFEQHTVRIAQQYGALYTKAHTLANTHITKQYVDHVAFGLEHDVKVTRSQPFPHAVYRMQQDIDGHDIVLQFAIETKNPFIQALPEQTGCCTIAGQCFVGTSPTLCQQQQGLWSQTCDCALFSPDYTQQYQGNTCGDRQHGESWCEVNVGVGGRFVRHSCWDGTIIQDYCKDYRQELCVQQHINNKTQAYCRPNYYSSCQTCTTRQCCEDTQQRDCTWMYNTCVPAVAPGFPFWQSQQSCTINCPTCTLPQQAELCVQVGDCGNQFNTIGQQGERTSFGLPYVQPQYDTRNVAFLVTQPDTSGTLQQRQQASLSRLLSSVLQNIDNLTQIPLQDYVDVQQDIPVPNTAFCNAWNAPTESYCSYCMQQECSEYLCKSLGSNCLFSIVRGEPFCFGRDTAQQTPTITNMSISYNASPIQAFGLQGYHIKEPIELQRPLSIQVNTSTALRCKPTHIPSMPFVDSSAPDMSSFSFSQHHDFQLRFVSNFDIFSRFTQALNISDDKATALVQHKFQFELLAQRFPQLEKFRFGYYPLLRPIAQQIIEQEKTMDELLQLFDDNIYHIFFRCMDTSATEYDLVFFRFSFAAVCEDNDPPQVQDIVVQQQEVTLYLDEFAHCRWDEFNTSYYNMQNDMQCAQSRFDHTNALEYRCQTSTNMSSLYVACIDNPDWIQVGPGNASVHRCPSCEEEECAYCYQTTNVCNRFPNEQVTFIDMQQTWNITQQQHLLIMDPPKQACRVVFQAYSAEFELIDDVYQADISDFRSGSYTVNVICEDEQRVREQAIRIIKT